MTSPTPAPPPTDPVTLGALIRAGRTPARMSQADLARVLDVTQTAVSYWETGDRIPDFPTADRIAQALHLPVCAFSARDHHPGDSTTRHLHLIGVLRTRMEALAAETDRVWREAERLAAACDAKDRQIREARAQAFREAAEADTCADPGNGFALRGWCTLRADEIEAGGDPS